MPHGSVVVVSDFLSTTIETNLAWPDHFLGAGHYRLQAIMPCMCLKGSLATREYFETLLLAILIADGSTVLINVPLGSGNCFSNTSEAVFGTGLKYFRSNIF